MDSTRLSGVTMIVVCPLSAVDNVVKHFRPARLITLINQDMMIDTPDEIETDRHLKLTMNDINFPQDGLKAARETDVERLISFIDDWDGTSTMAIHCWAGISRSTAAAFVTLCRLNPETDEHVLAGALRTASPSATPNRLIVRHADALLERNGRMIDAVAAIGRGAEASEGKVFQLKPFVQA